MVVMQVNIRVWTIVIERVRTRLVFVLRLNTIFGFQYRASTRSRLQTLKTCWRMDLESGPSFADNWFVLNFPIFFFVGNLDPTRGQFRSRRSHQSTHRRRNRKRRFTQRRRSSRQFVLFRRFHWRKRCVAICRKRTLFWREKRLPKFVRIFWAQS